MKALTGRVLAAVTTLTMLSACSSALAAEAEPAATVSPATAAISVQLDGKNLTFTDAAPMAKDGRTFLPVRAVFEAMGAEVGYDAATSQITATRGATTVTMTLGSTLVTVTKDGAASDQLMDVAPYAENNATFVPVRFAAQAFGCTVGWDQDDSTVILVDTEKLLDSTLTQYEFTYMDKYQDYSAQFQAGIWDMTAAFDGAVSVLGAGPLTVEGTMDGTIAEATRLSADMTLKMDMDAFLDSLSEMSGQTSEMSADDRALLDALKSEGLGLEMRGDLATGKVYFTMSGKALEALGLPTGSWYSMDMDALYGQMGMDFSSLMDASKALDAAALLQSALSGVQFSDKDTAYATVSGLVEQAAKFLADESFVKNGNDHITTYTLEQDGTKLDASLTLTMNGDKVVGYAMDMKVSTEMDDGTGSKALTDIMTVTSSMDAKNHMTTSVKMALPPLMDVSLNLTGDYAAGDKAPETEPPAGATVIPYEQLMGGGTGNMGSAGNPAA